MIISVINITNLLMAIPIASSKLERVFIGEFDGKGMNSVPGGFSDFTSFRRISLALNCLYGLTNLCFRARHTGNGIFLFLSSEAFSVKLQPHLRHCMASYLRNQWKYFHLKDSF